MLSGQIEDAVDDFSGCLALDPDYAQAYSARAGAYVKLRRYEDALKDMESAVRVRPGRSDDLHNRAVILASLGRYREAIGDYERAIVLNPGSAGSFNNLAWILATAEDPSIRDGRKAVAYARKALKMGKNGAWMDTLAAAYAECGEFKKAAAVETAAYRLSRPPNETFRKRIEIYKSNKRCADSVLQALDTQ